MTIEFQWERDKEAVDKKSEIESIKEKIVDAYIQKWNAEKWISTPLTREQKDKLVSADLQTLDATLFPLYSETELKMLVGELATLDKKTPEELNLIKKAIKTTKDIATAFPLTTWTNAVNTTIAEMKIKSDALKAELDEIDVEEEKVRTELDEVKKTTALLLEKANMWKVAPVAKESVERQPWYLSLIDGKTLLYRWFKWGHPWIDIDPIWDPENPTQIPSIHSVCAWEIVEMGNNRTEHFSWYGNHIIIKKEEGIYVLYAHMKTDPTKNKENVKKLEKGETIKVEKWEIIGVVWNTGQSTGLHLHIEVRKWKDWEHAKSSEYPDGYLTEDPKIEFPEIFTPEKYIAATK